MTERVKDLNQHTLKSAKEALVKRVLVDYLTNNLMNSISVTGQKTMSTNSNQLEAEKVQLVKEAEGVELPLLSQEAKPASTLKLMRMMSGLLFRNLIRFFTLKSRSNQCSEKPKEKD